MLLYFDKIIISEKQKPKSVMDNRNVIEVTLKRRGRMKYWQFPENTQWPNAREWRADKRV